MISINVKHLVSAALFFLIDRKYSFDNLEDMATDDLVHDVNFSHVDDVVDEKAFVVLNSASKALEDTPCIAYVSSLRSLAPDLVCHQCSAACSIEEKRVGSACIFIWVQYSMFTY